MNATEAFANEMEKTVLYPASWPKREHFNNFGGEVGQDASDHLSGLEDKKVKRIQNYSEIEQLMTFFKELQKGEVDPKMKEQDLTPGFSRNCVIRASAMIIRQIQNNLETPHEVVTGILDLFKHSLRQTKQLSLPDEVTIPYSEFVFRVSKEDCYSLHDRVAWMKEVSHILLIGAAAKLNRPLYWVLYGRSQMILANLYQGDYRVVVLKHALQRLASVDSLPDVKVIKGILYAELAMLQYEEDLPDSERTFSSEISMTQKEREYAIELGFMVLDNAASYSIEKLDPRPYARQLWAEQWRVLWFTTANC